MLYKDKVPGSNCSSPEGQKKGPENLQVLGPGMRTKPSVISVGDHVGTLGIFAHLFITF